jgi:predicted nucleic acid-binding protein
MRAKALTRTAGTKSTQEQVFVLDGSVALAWFFEDETNAYAESVEDSLEHATAVVPSLWSLEVSNALLMGERRRRTIEANVMQFVSLLGELPIVMDEKHNAEHVFAQILTLARTHQLSAYDAAYLELALRRGVPLATLDRRLQTAAKAAGIALYAV